MLRSFRPKLNRKTVDVKGNSNNNNNNNQNQNVFRNEPKKFFGGNGGGSALKLIPLGGVGIVQKNCFLYEYEDDIIMIDCGVGFPDEGMPGVDLIIPDISYLKDKKHKLKGIVITHAHDDHIGGLPYIWPELNVPIYSQKLTCGFIKNKFVENRLPKDQIKTVKIDDKIKLGKFEVSFYQVSHSVPDSTGIVIKTPVGTLIHQADFKIDWTPVIHGQVTDVAAAATVGRNGVNLMTIDCLGVEKNGYTLSERNIEQTFDRIEKETKGKLIITLMSSNIARIQQALNVAAKSGRKVAILGRSMENNFQVARDLGYLDVPAGIIINQEQIKGFVDKNLMLIMAGSLGQPGSALSRAANGDHKFVQIKKTDTVVFSADPMPSAVVNQGALINNLTKIGCDVYASTLTPDLHVSGHAAAEEIKLMINLVRPQYLMPMGGEFRHMKAFAKMAQTLGYREDQILLPQEGQTVMITKNKDYITEGIRTQNIYVDGLGVGDVGNIVLRDRQVMSEEGVVVVVVPIDHQTGRLGGDIDVISRGFIFEEGNEDIIDAAIEIAQSHLREKKDGALDWRYARKQIEDSLKKFFYQEIKRSPLILPIVVEV